MNNYFCSCLNYFTSNLSFYLSSYKINLIIIRKNSNDINLDNKLEEIYGSL